jgi:hypothetical protein
MIAVRQIRWKIQIKMVGINGRNGIIRVEEAKPPF